MRFLATLAPVSVLSVALACSAEVSDSGPTDSPGTGDAGDSDESNASDPSPDEADDPQGVFVAPEQASVDTTCDRVAAQPTPFASGELPGRLCLTAEEAAKRHLDIEFPAAEGVPYCADDAAEICPNVGNTGAWLRGCDVQVESPAAQALYNEHGFAACCYDILVGHCF